LETKNKRALVGWDQLCKPKNAGGLSLRDPDLLRKALGAKLWWICVTIMVKNTCNKVNKDKIRPWSWDMYSNLAECWAKT